LKNPAGFSVRFLGWHGLILIFFVAGVRAVSNILYFKTYGPLSSAGADIWFFIGVAKGYYHLFWADPLQWMLPIFGNLTTHALFYLLLLLSNALHLVTVLLLFGLLREVYGNTRIAFWTSAIYSCLSSSFLFCTGTFLHQQVSLPFIMAAIWTGHRYVTSVPGKQRVCIVVIFILLIIVGSFVGPDIWVLVATAIPCSIGWRLRNWSTPVKRQIAAFGLMIGCGTVVIFSGPFLKQEAASMAWMMRGIDLVAQQDLHVGDLMPLTWARWMNTYSWLGFAMLALVAVAFLRGRFFEITLFFVPILFAAQAVRFFFITEIGVAFLICWFLVATTRWRSWLPDALGVIFLVALFSLEEWRGFTCLCPATLVSSLSKVRDDPSQKNLVLCNPSYGFLVRSFTGAQPTSDMQHLESNMEQMRLLVLPAAKAVAQLKQRGVTHVLLTSHDFKQVVERAADGRMVQGMYASGGLEYWVPASEKELKGSLLYQSFTELFWFAPISGVKLISARADPKTSLVVILYKLE